MSGASELMLAVTAALARHMPLPLANEKDLQAAVHVALRDEGYETEREVRLGLGSVIDHTVRTPYSDLTVGVECKIRGVRAQITQQLCRYAASGEIDALIFVSQTSTDLPYAMHGIPVIAIRPSGTGGLA